MNSSVKEALNKVPDKKKPTTDLVKSYARELKSQGVQGIELYEAVAEYHVSLKRAKLQNRCPRCWHDVKRRCICKHVSSLFDKQTLYPLLDVKVLILMHYKEYYSAGNSAKLLLAMLPPSHAELFLFGVAADWKRFEEELSIDPHQTMMLWPGVDAISIERFFEGRLRLPCSKDCSATISTATVTAAAATTPTITTTTSTTTAIIPTPTPTTNPSSSFLRVVVLDGVFNHASTMFKNMKRRLPSNIMPRTVALHPPTTSVFHRAAKRYAKDSAASVAKSSNPKALRVSTVEAYSLLLSELGEREEVTSALVSAVVVNNLALEHNISVRPDCGMATSTTSGAAKRKLRRSQQLKQREEETKQLEEDGEKEEEK